MTSVWLLLTSGLVLAMVSMALIWVICIRIRNAGIVDIAWALNFSLIALLYWQMGAGNPVRKTLITGMFAVWSLRLGIYLFRRVAKHHPEEDGRYATLRNQFPKNTNLMFLGFFELQAVLNALLSLPIAFAVVNPTASPTIIEIGALVVWLLAVIGESVADFQLNTFRAFQENKGKTCRAGLWRFSRHPNYFFEWLIWVAFFLFACGSPWGWLSFICPLLMWHFLINVTGIRATEEHALKSRGDDYRRYQQETNMFFPWFPRKTNL